MADSKTLASPSTMADVNLEKSSNLEKTAPPLPDTLPENQTPAKKRRRRKKHLENAAAIAIGKARALRPHTKAGIYSEKLIDKMLQKQLGHGSKGKRKRINGLNRELNIEALIAHSVGFPTDSLTEEEIEAGVVCPLGGSEQANYIVVRNHILSLWRANVKAWLTKDQAMESIRKEHSALVDSAYTFLLRHGFVNFGLSPSKPEPMHQPRARGHVLVIGAGLSGLAASKQLITLGFRVLILEGRNRPGGRVHTKRMSGNDIVAAADLGGSVLTGINGNPLGVLARQLGFPLHKVRDICPLYLPDGRAVDSEVDSRVEALFNQLLEKVCKLRQSMDDMAVDVSLGTALDTFREVYRVAENQEERMLLNWHHANLEYANASLLSDLSLAFWDQDDPYEMGGDHCFIPGGNGRFVKALSEGLPIFYGKTVDLIRYGTNGVQVRAGNQVFQGDMVLCTVPLGVLKKGSIKFEPELPQSKNEAIQKLGFGLLNKVAMLFPHCFWGAEIDTFGHLSVDKCKRGEFFLFYSYASVSGGPLLMALVAGESAIGFESMAPSDAVERVLGILRGIFRPKGIIVPHPIQAVCTRWGSDQFTYGSYSHVAVGASGDDYDILAESVGQGRVFFAGEATNRRYPATMHGAFLSGLREAANISRIAESRSKPENIEVKDEFIEDDALFDLFKRPDLCFGCFSALFDPRTSDLGSNSIVRVLVGKGTNGVEYRSAPLRLYALMSRKQVIDLEEVDGDINRLKVLYQSFGAKLVGVRGLGSEGGELIAYLKGARINGKIEILNAA
ncbi:lysine-specific histone demethylase 1 homolog 1 [Amborella trichopoda]|uniref:SWIRM domain-containing protein n=1 Tax=Amborella trichopoda TaxID=13333 RepID=U5CXI1_AMBTC|nr:lysine-specific histone demethylase 1 homolog 1 [Amborella trichopoda]ERN14660.1 hypothetical protein AMTR_s00038p00206970 [Amborella trichopoda]|eukprot:XP_006853193.1 lysine-specific histone demethylase 1 homolog 1 [Amborella trichopoda]